MTVRLESVTFKSGDGETSIPSYLATPGGEGPFPAVLLLHGTEDERAPMADMRRMEVRMSALGKVCAFKFYEGARHGFAVRTHPGYDEHAAHQSFDEAKRFLETYLLTGPATPS